ncbi:MAG: hypothetical protein DRR16_16085 [Candidatus Parabeggiatoa sp. nov. 3]|nr:MAG: hypothetical protein DRR00_00600 [Gammaproteobacteria bacterium]RKZ69726.1 MAG: hypothetical protein DRQ99_00015 [Gammaproteobacteria bacterium]RKZ83925.1 MAG: hypothetical protein DRR16_16085 [Gammaproteobacteria bacterium]
MALQSKINLALQSKINLERNRKINLERNRKYKFREENRAFKIYQYNPFFNAPFQSTDYE